jgi:hypothetical protein
MTHYSPSRDIMMHHLISKETPELEHLRADAVCNSRSVSRKYSAIRSTDGLPPWLRFVVDADIVLRSRSADISPGSLDQQHQLCRTRMIDMRAFAYWQCLVQFPS